MHRGACSDCDSGHHTSEITMVGMSVPRGIRMVEVMGGECK